MNLAIVDDVRSEAAEFSEKCHIWAKNTETPLNVDWYESGKLFLTHDSQKKYEVLFLDIYMDGLSGIETAKILRKADQKCLIVFLTSSAEYMREAFPCHVFDYILKPASQERVSQVLSDVCRMLPDRRQSLYLPSGRETVCLSLDEIVSISMDGNYACVQCIDHTTHKCRVTFTELLTKLSSCDCFLTVNKGVLVNMDYIQSLADYTCCMEDGSVFPVRVRDHDRITAQLDQYRFGRLRSRQGGAL